MIRSFLRYAALAGVVGLGACKLDIGNPNQPETKRVLATPLDAESVLGSYYNRWHNAMYGTTSNIWGMAAVQSFEDYSSLSNECMGQRVGIPRAANDNSVGNGCDSDQKLVYFRHNEVNRVASTIITKFNDPTYTLSAGTPQPTARDLRARAFGEFLRGISLGYLSLIYDSSAIVSPTMSSDPTLCNADPASGTCQGQLRGYKEVNDSAMAALTRAITLTNTVGNGTGGFPIPGAWIPSTTTLSAAEFVKLIRSYRARFRAGVARTPAERQDISVSGGLVDWNAVIADAQNGITADHVITTNSVSGPFMTWVAQWMAYGTWHQMAPFVIGMGDGSDGAYAAWIAQPLDSRGTTGSYFQVSPDLRFPQGATRTLQQGDFALAGNTNSASCSTAGSVCKRYFVNRPGGSDPVAGNGWGLSNYDHARFYTWRTAGSASGLTGQNGPFPFMVRAEIDMLQAEGILRTQGAGGAAAAAVLINRTRAACGYGLTIPAAPAPNVPNTPAGCVAKANNEPGGGLPALDATDFAQVNKGGADCVPKIPQAANGPVVCGSMFEAMKYEKRIETAYTHFAGWFVDMRGWGDLPAGTGTDWPVPYADLQARGRPTSAVYSTGGSTGYHVAGASTYGW